LCITHLPQIAAMADTHFLIEKKTDGEKTVTSVFTLGDEGTVLELARLIGGAKITLSTRKAAEEMKLLANQMKCTT
jgi:DNA repair protein RecN (Recombination protein N)